MKLQIIGHEGNDINPEIGITYGAAAILNLDTMRVFNAVTGFDSSWERYCDDERLWVCELEKPIDVTDPKHLPSYILRMSPRIVGVLNERLMAKSMTPTECVIGFENHAMLVEWGKSRAASLRHFDERKAARVLDPWEGMTREQWIKQFTQR